MTLRCWATETRGTSQPPSFLSLLDPMTGDIMAEDNHASHRCFPRLLASSPCSVSADTGMTQTQDMDAAQTAIENMSACLCDRPSTRVRAHGEASAHNLSGDNGSSNSTPPPVSIHEDPEREGTNNRGLDSQHIPIADVAPIEDSDDGRSNRMSPSTSRRSLASSLRDRSVAPQADVTPTASPVSISTTDPESNITNASVVCYAEHEVNKGDTFEGICLKYRISATQLRRANCFSGRNLQLAPNPLRIPLSGSDRHMMLNVAFVGDVEPHAPQASAVPICEAPRHDQSPRRLWHLVTGRREREQL